MIDITDRVSNRVSHQILTAVLLILIIAVGAWLRLIGIDWGEGHLLHPDERFLLWVTADMRPVSSLAEYFDTLASTLNPNNVGHGFYVYGDWPVILLKYISLEVNRPSMYELNVVGRSLSTIADLLTIVVLFFVGKRLFDRRVGLVASAMYAGAAFPIQQSHFFTVDTFTNLFVVASMYFAARVLTGHRWVDYLLFGIMLGLAMSSKISVFPLAMILIVALTLRMWREWQGNQATPNHIQKSLPETQTLRHTLAPLLMRAGAGLAIAGLVTIITFRIGQPYAFLPPQSGHPIDTAALRPGMTLISRIGDPVGLRPNPLWLDQMSEVRRQVSGYSDIPPNHQWGKRLPLVYPWVNIVRIGMGWPLGLWCWLAFAWAVWEMVRGYARSARLVLPVLWIVLFFTWQGIGWVKTMRYFLPVYPFLFLLGAWAIWTVWDRVQALLAVRQAPRWHPSARAVASLGVLLLGLGLLWGFAVSRIYTRPVTRIAASHWIYENIPSDVTLMLQTPDGVATFNAGLDNNWPMLVPKDEEDPRQPSVYYTYLYEGVSQPFPFRSTISGELVGMRFTHIKDANGNQGPHRVRVAIATGPDEQDLLASADIVADFSVHDDPRGSSYSFTLDAPVALVAGQPYWLLIQPIGANLIVSGSTIATEGDWDDPLPLPTPPYYPWEAQFHAYEFQMAWEDTVDKRLRMEYILDHSDYIVISSNRFYDSLRRNPRRFPLSVTYYRALFSGELGFELVGDFTSRPNLGPIEFYDDNAEEAWTVYDHPRVLIFKKTNSYDPLHTVAVLDAVDLSNVERVIAKDAAGWPAAIPMPQMKQQTGIPESDGAPDSDVPGPGLYRSFQPLAVVVWYVYIALVGWAGFPLLYTLFPGLPDRGYGISRIFGLLFTAWLSWLLASMEVLTWTGPSVIVAVIILVMASTLVLRTRRTEFVGWLHAQGTHLLTLEAVVAGTFLFFLLVRLGNPDLWHPYFGGEKPMDLSYFNAVLNSQSFPPYDPWFSGETINYYYFGFVVVGAPVKVLGIPGALAYNLILPTLFALTGTGAFSAAYNLLAPLQQDIPTGEEAATPPPTGPKFWQAIRAWPRISPGEVLAAFQRTLTPTWKTRFRQAYAAGWAALLLTVVLGNLDQVRTLIWGLAELGAGKSNYDSAYLPALEDVSRGASMVLFEGQILHTVPLGDWYWNATRVIPVPISEDGSITLEVDPITEFPFFTFLYADLHAHMIAMPLSLLVLNWCIAQIRRRESPRTAHLLASLFMGALAIGALRPTNTWDWPTYLAIGIAALALGHAIRRGDRAALPALGLGAVLAVIAIAAIMVLAAPLIDPAVPVEQRMNFQAIFVTALGVGGVALVIGFGLGLALSRPRQETSDLAAAENLLRPWATLIQISLQAAALVGLNILLFLPFIQDYDLGYTSAVPWTGSKTPIWAYLDIHGLFLFITVSWLVWESWQWWQAVRIVDGRTRRSLVLPIVFTSVVMLGVGIVASRAYPVALIALPLILWALGLFVRADQPIEKRAALVLLIVALALTMIVEMIVLQGDISRMNTVFKFYLQVWVLLAIVAGAALGWLWPAIQQARSGLRGVWISALMILVFMAALYPLLATRAKIADRWKPGLPITLDGMAYMQYVDHSENGRVFSLKPDYEALRWLQDNVSGAPVVLEAHSAREYLWGNRVAVYTGLPSVVGWRWHQVQQRAIQAPEVNQRVEDVELIYNTPDINEAVSFLRQYNVDLIMVGELERAYYEPAGLQKFDLMVQQGLLQVIYERDGTRIYQVMKSQEAAAWSPS